MSIAVEIVEYRAEWRQIFDRHRFAITNALRDRALQVEHIGSTSVPDLAAKPVVDILLVVERAGDEDAYLPQLQRAGYEVRVREPDWHQHRMLTTEERHVNVHVFSAGCSEIELHVRFRDWLRENAADRQVYENVKRGLATQKWVNMDVYATAKTAVIETILARARSTIDRR